MKKMLAVLFVLIPTAAFAGGDDGAIGVGAETDIAGRVGGLSVNYNLEKFHVGALLGFSDTSAENAAGDTSSFTIGGRAYYHISSTSAADFGLGGGLYLRHTKFEILANDETTDELILDLGFQIRAFITNQVALSFSGGLNIGAADANGVDLAGSLTGGAGVHYYF